MTNGGLHTEALKFLTGCPASLYSLKSDLNSDANLVWNKLTDATANNYLIGINVPDSKNGINGIIGGHAYSVLGTYVVSNATSSFNLVKVRNPWGSDTWTGDWSDNYVGWKTVNGSSINKVSNDGDFFVDMQDIMSVFSTIVIGNYSENSQVYFTESLNDDGQIKMYEFTSPVTQTISLSMEFYNSRMYTPGCRTGAASKGTLTLMQNG